MPFKREYRRFCADTQETHGQRENGKRGNSLSQSDNIHADPGVPAKPLPGKQNARCYSYDRGKGHAYRHHVQMLDEQFHDNRIFVWIRE
jgi:hypothetical protein